MTTVTVDQLSLKKIALPAEHGGWGIVLEPAVLGLAVVPSAAGVAIGLAALLAFLARQPLKIAASDLRRGRFYPRTRPAIVFASAYGAGALLMLSAAVLAAGPTALLPLLFALPFGILQLFFDARNESREWIAEISGCVATGSVASAIALAGGASPPLAYALWLLMLCRSIPAVLYVRSRLRLERGKASGRVVPLIAHVIAFALAVWIAPFLAAVAMGVLLLRAAVGLSPLRRSARAQTIGFTEIGYGVLTITLIACGYLL